MSKVIKRAVAVKKMVDRTSLPINPPKEPRRSEKTRKDKERYVLLSEFLHYSIDIHATLMRSCSANDLASDFEFELLDEEDYNESIPNFSEEKLAAYLSSRLKNPLAISKPFAEILDAEPDAEARVLTPEEAKRIEGYLVKAFARLMALRKLSPHDLQSEYIRVRDLAIKKYKEDWQTRARDNDDLSFLNEAELSPDQMTDWLAYEHWTREEAIALSLGMDPAKVNIASLHDLTLPSLFLDEFTRRLKLLLRSNLNSERLDLLKHAIGSEISAPLTHSAFIDWCREKGLDIPSELSAGRRVISAREFDKLEKKVRELEQTVAAHEVLVQEIDAKSRKSLFALLLGMAIDGYAHRIGEGEDETANSEATKVIAASVSNFGYSITQKTVKTWLTKCEKDRALSKMMASIRKNYPEKVAVKKFA